MIDRKIFEQAKADLNARREEAALKIFNYLIDEIGKCLSPKSIRLSKQELCEIIEENMSTYELEKLIVDFLPVDSGIIFYHADMTVSERPFSFDFSEWLNN